MSKILELSFNFSIKSKSKLIHVLLENKRLISLGHLNPINQYTIQLFNILYIYVHILYIYIRSYIDIISSQKSINFQVPQENKRQIQYLTKKRNPQKNHRHEPQFNTHILKQIETYMDSTNKFPNNTF